MLFLCGSGTALTIRSVSSKMWEFLCQTACDSAPRSLSCTAEMRRHLEWERTDWHIVVDSRLRVSCTEDTFVVEIDLQAQHNGALVFERRWREEVPHVLG